MIGNLAKFFNRIVENAVYVSRGTLWRKHCWLFETKFDFGRESFAFAAENLQPCYQICTIVFRWAIGRKILKIFLFFLIFFRTSREHFLVFQLYHSRHGSPNWDPPAKRNISIKEKFVRKLFVLSVLWAHFFEHSLKSFRHVTKTTVYLFIGALWERLSIIQNFSYVFCDFERYSSRTLAKSFSSIAQTAF